MSTPLFRLNPSVMSTVLWQDVFSEFGLHSRCLTAVLLPAASFGFTSQ